MDGLPWCWGKEYSESGLVGNLRSGGYRDYSYSYTPAEKKGFPKISGIAISNKTICTTPADSPGLLCWGYNSSYSEVLGTADTDSWVYSPVAIDGPLEALRVTALSGQGDFDTYCAAADASYYCWGYGGSGEIGNGTTEGANPVPTEVVLAD